jgi:hypothetical protein
VPAAEAVGVLVRALAAIGIKIGVVTDDGRVGGGDDAGSAELN